jgi:hypothetical protein
VCQRHRGILRPFELKQRPILIMLDAGTNYQAEWAKLLTL